MNIVKKWDALREFGDSHHPKWIDFLRMSLGVAIFIKGIVFLSNPEALLTIMRESNLRGWSFILEHHVAFTYLVGGILIAIGLLTRIAILFALLVFIGSIFCCITNFGFFSVYSDLAFSIVVFFLLIFFLIIGPGPWSVDRYMKLHVKEPEG